MLTCRCEADLSKIQTAQVSDNVVDLMGILQHKLHSLPWESFRGKRGFPLEHLNNISLLSVLRLISKLAKFGTTEAEDNVPSINNMEAVASALSDWPKGFHQFLLNIGHYTNSRDTNSAGIHKWFRHINRAIFDYGRFGQDVEFLHHEYLRFALSKWGFGVIHERYLHGLEEESRYLSLLELSKRIGLNRSTLVKWVQDGRLPIKKVSTTNSIRYIVDISVTSISKQNEGKVLSARDAAKILRFPTDVLILLRKSGHFSVNHQPEQRIGYHEKDVEVFHQQLLQCSVLKEPPRLMTNVIAYTEVMAHVKFGSTSAKAKFVSGYLEGAVCSIGRWGSSLSDICFDKHYVLDYAMRSRANSLKPHLSRRLAARLLQCHETAIPGLLSASFLADVKAERGVSFICKDSLNSFLLKYISLASQANRLQTTVKRLFNIAENEGIFLLKIKSGHNLRSVSFFLLQEDQTRLDAAVVKYPTRKVSHTAR
jgi:predicted DNA-binding transcriptional regulator AlpA